MNPNYSAKDIVFIISLPRSGSTLLQSALASTKQVDTCAEPWILLKLTELINPPNVYSATNYSNKDCHMAINDFLTSRGVEKTILASCIRDSYLRLVGRRTSVVFIDKTPRYYLIIDELLEIFPESKFIFLTRNPFDVLSSIGTTWWNNRLKPHHHHIDLFRGTLLLDRALTRYSDRRNVFITSYESITNPAHNEVASIAAFVGIEWDPDKEIQLETGHANSIMGDKNILKTKTINTPSNKNRFYDSITKWLYQKYYRDWLIKNMRSDQLRAYLSSDKRTYLKNINPVGSTIDALLLSSSIISRALNLATITHRFSTQKFREKLD